jgi:hypothetical protein
MKYCPFCGERVYKSASYCINCGKRLDLINDDEKGDSKFEYQEQKHDDRVFEAKLATEKIEERDERKIIKSIEKDEIATKKPRILPDQKRGYVPSLLIRDKDVSKWIIDYDGKRIDVISEFGEETKIKVLLDGELIKNIKKPDEVNLLNLDGYSGSHVLEIWFSRGERRSAFSSSFKRAGVGIKIDNIPVRNTLADPLEGIESSLIGLFGFAFFFSFKFIKLIISDSFVDMAIIYIFGAIACLLFAFNLKRIPKIALYGGAVLGIIEITDFAFGGISEIIKDLESNSSFTTGAVALIFWGAFRLWLLNSIFKAIKAFKKL